MVDLTGPNRTMKTILSMFKIKFPVEFYPQGCLKSISIEIGSGWVFTLFFTLILLLVKKGMI